MTWGRAYFGVQATAGAAWWIAVALSPFVRDATLGSLDLVAVAIVDIPLFVVASAVAAAGPKSAAWIATGWTVIVAVTIALFATVTGEAGWGALIMIAAAGASVVALALVVMGRVPTSWIISGPFAFKPADSTNSATTNVAATFAQIVLFWGFFLGVVPALLTLIERRWGVSMDVPAAVPYAGIAVFVLASALGIWSAISMSVGGRGTPLPSAMPNRLVIAGPYRFVRNPMAVAGFVQGMAVGLMLSSWLVVVYGLAGSFLWNYAIRPHEEADLERRFGAEFRHYRTHVRCWVPSRVYMSRPFLPRN